MFNIVIENKPCFFVFLGQFVKMNIHAAYLLRAFDRYYTIKLINIIIMGMGLSQKSVAFSTPPYPYTFLTSIPGLHAQTAVS